MGLFNAAKGVTTPDWNPLYDNLSGNGQNMSNRWADLLKKGIPARSDPFWEQQMQNARNNAMQAQGLQGDAYGIMQAIQQGGPTAAQGAIQQGTQMQQNALQSGAAGAAGGARGAAAAQGTAGLAGLDASLQGDAALQGQQASDVINAQQMMQGLSQAMREGTQRDLGMFNQNAFDSAQNRLGWRALNDQNALDYGKLMQDEWFGAHGFGQDRQRLADDSWWAKNAIDRANQAGAIGAAMGSLGYAGKAMAGDSGGGSSPQPHTPTSQTDDYINSDEQVKEDITKRTTKRDRDEKVDKNWRRWETLRLAADGTEVDNSYPSHPYIVSDEHVKEDVRKQAYQEGLSDARHGYTGIEDLLKNAEGKAKPSLAAAIPAQPRMPTSTRELLGNLSLPPGYVPPPAKPAVDPSTFPPEFQALLKSLQAPSAVRPPLAQVVAPQPMPSEFQGLYKALQQPTPIVDPTVDRFSSDERQKTNIDEADPFLDALARGRASYEYKDPSYEPNPGKGGRSLGVMAQELERVPGLGAQLVDDTPNGKMVNVKSLVSALAAGEGTLHDRYGDIEARVRRLEGGKRRG